MRSSRIAATAWRRVRSLGMQALPDPVVARLRACRQARDRARSERERPGREAQLGRHEAEPPQRTAAGRLQRSEQERLYWSVNSLFHAVLGDGRVLTSMPPDDPNRVDVHDLRTGLRAHLLLEPHAERFTVLVRSPEGDESPIGEFEGRQAAVYAVLRRLLEHAPASGSGPAQGPRRIWVPIVDGRRVPPMLRVGAQWTSALHRSGWAGAMETLASLHDERGVLFDGFLESTFCWRDTGQVHRKPWVGVCHNPPGTPAWLETTNEDLFANARFRRSLRHCRGLFVLSEHHRRELAGRVDVPVSVIPLPSDTPPRTFSPDAFEENPRPRLVQVGHWLRNPNSLYQLPTRRLVKTRLDVGHPWEETTRKHVPPTEPLDLESVETLPRLSDAEYDELLARNLVFLDLLDSSANNAIVECIVRSTPVLVNRTPAVVEYLGRDYPFYFESLEEAARKAESPELVRRTHRYLRALPKERFTREGFLHAFVTSEVYRALVPPPAGKLLLLAPGGTERALLRALRAGPGLRILEQPFHPERGAWDDASHHAYRDEARQGEGLDRCLDGILYVHTGLSHGLGQLPAPLERQLAGRPAARLLVRRRNRVAAATLAVLDDAVAAPPSEIGAFAPVAPVDPEAVAERLRRDAERLEGLRAHLQAEGLAFREIVLEDLLPSGGPWSEREARLRELLEALGIPEPDARTWERIATALRETEEEETARLARLPNAAAIERALGEEADRP